jgi:ferredoxin
MSDDGSSGTPADGGDVSPSDIGGEGPPISEKPYKIVFEANKCFGAGRCAEVADNWEMDVGTGLASPRSYYIGEDELAENVRAAELCPAKKERGVIHVVDRRTDEEIAPDPHGDGTLSVDW